MTGQTLRISVELDISPSTSPAGPGAALPTRRRIACRVELPARRVYMDGPHSIAAAGAGLGGPGRAYEVRGLDPARMHLLFVAIDNDADIIDQTVDGEKRYQVLTEPPEVEYAVGQTTKKFFVALKASESIDYQDFVEGMFALPDDVGLMHVNALTVSSARPGRTEGTIVVRVVTPGTTTAEPFLLLAELQEEPGDAVLQWEWLAP